MTYDPHRNQIPPHPSREDRDLYQNGNRDPYRSGASAAILLGALLLAAIGGFIYFYTGTDDRTAATNDMRPPITQPSTTGSAPAPETTGSSANMPPAPAPRLEPKVKPVE